MVVRQIPDGATCEYSLRPSKSGLRLERSCASYDLITMIRDAGGGFTTENRYCTEARDTGVWDGRRRSAQARVVTHALASPAG
jgi:hypothetical protein